MHGASVAGVSLAVAKPVTKSATADMHADMRAEAEKERKRRLTALDVKTDRIYHTVSAGKGIGD